MVLLSPAMYCRYEPVFRAAGMYNKNRKNAFGSIVCVHKQAVEFVKEVGQLSGHGDTPPRLTAHALQPSLRS